MISLEKLAADPRVVVRNREGINPRGRCVVYRMRRSQRALDNYALETAIAAASALDQPVVVFFGLLAAHPPANLRHYTFMLEGLAETAQKLAQRKIGFVVRIGSGRAFARFCAEVSPSLVVYDEDPARRDATWAQEASLFPSAPLWSVDADVIVPSKLIGKEQFAARTIRPRIHKHLKEYLKAVGNHPVRAPWKDDRSIQSLPVSPELTDRLHLDTRVSPVKTFHGGTDAALRALSRFIRDRLRGYAKNRNHPETDATSQLSPYLHFGQIGPHTVALAIDNAAAPADDREAFLEELIVRRELAVNFVRYNPRFRTLAGVEPWARLTLDAHARDRRPRLYTEGQLANTETHDPLWNAAQRQMVTSGWMHGYLRMYWAKKILEWSPTPEEAYDICVRLNDRYELDGRDPNGYAGIAWAVGGKHDRAWGPERPVYGKIRYMSLASTSRKFDSRAYIEKWNA
ncbi:MAG: deoxyribodipyrimidine photo-lyase [Candidatus Binataceae bacterium]|jgi:deoxyribodipyrimidine photo-lyase